MEELPVNDNRISPTSVDGHRRLKLLLASSPPQLVSHREDTLVVAVCQINKEINWKTRYRTA
jgi:hypothetical protein